MISAEIIFFSLHYKKIFLCIIIFRTFVPIFIYRKMKTGEYVIRFSVNLKIMGMKKLLFFTVFAFLTFQNFAQAPLHYQDFHLAPSPGTPSLNTIILVTNYINVDSVNYSTYNLTSTSPCTYGYMNGFAYCSKTTTPIDSSNIYVLGPVPSKHYYISNQTGVYDDGNGNSYYMSCQLGLVWYTAYATSYSNSARILSYPVTPGATFSDSSYSTYRDNWGGCQDPGVINTSISSSFSSLIKGKVLSVGKLITPCATYDSVYFIRRILYSDEVRQVHTYGMDTSYHYIDTSYTEKYKIKTTNIIGIVKNHHYILFNEQIMESSKYFPNPTFTIDTFARFFYRDPSASISTNEEVPKTNVFPNPFSISTQISFDKTYQNLDLSIIDLQGKIIQQKSYHDCNKITLDRAGIANGFYFLRVSLDGKFVETKKVVVTD